MTDYRNKPYKLITELARKDRGRNKEQRIGVLVTDPVLKSVPGPNSTEPLAPGDDPAAHPGSVVQWFVDVRTDGDQMLLRDCVIPNAARNLIGQVGSPVIVMRDSATGAWQVLNRADRSTPVQDVSSYTLVELEIGFVRGYQTIPGVGVVSAFYSARPDPLAILTAAKDGKNNAGLHRGVRGVDGNGDPIVDFPRGAEIRLIDFFDLVWGDTPFGAAQEVQHQADAEENLVDRF